MSKANFLFTLIGALTILIGCQGTAVLDDDSTGDDDDAGGNDVNYALSFDDSQEGRGVSEDTTAVSLGDNFTVELWFRRTGTFQGFFLDARQPNSTNFENWCLFQRDQEAVGLKFYCKTADDDPSLIGPDVNSYGTGWHHLAVVGTASGTRTMFIDGGIVASDQIPGCEIELPAPLALGHRDTPETANVLVDEVRISSVARYQAAFEPSESLEADSDTQLLWHFQEGQGSVATDEVAGLELDLDNIDWVVATE